MIKVKGQLLDIDILDELEGYSLERSQVRGEKLIASSPFRSERRPSFAVNLENGTWIDSGSTSDEWKKGNFVTLLAYFMNVSYEEAEEYLLEKYGAILKDTDTLKLDISLELKPEAPRIITAEELKKYRYRHKYLQGRGISEKVQRAFKVGYCKENGAITLPWFDKKGNVINVKFRSVRDKRFWYMRGGQPLKNHIYGIHFVIRGNYKMVYVVESEIDALYLWTQGVPAIAFGGANITEAQVQLILNSPIESLIISTDNDAVGQKFKRKLVHRLGGIVDLKELELPTRYKDVNEVPSTDILGILERVLPINPLREIRLRK